MCDTWRQSVNPQSRPGGQTSRSWIGADWRLELLRRAGFASTARTAIDPERVRGPRRARSPPARGAGPAPRGPLYTSMRALALSRRSCPPSAGRPDGSSGCAISSPSNRPRLLGAAVESGIPVLRATEDGRHVNLGRLRRPTALVTTHKSAAAVSRSPPDFEWPGSMHGLPRQPHVRAMDL
jgi:hypothetical protein